MVTSMICQIRSVPDSSRPPSSQQICRSCTYRIHSQACPELLRMKPLDPVFDISHFFEYLQAADLAPSALSLVHLQGWHTLLKRVRNHWRCRLSRQRTPVIRLKEMTVEFLVVATGIDDIACQDKYSRLQNQLLIICEICSRCLLPIDLRRCLAGRCLKLQIL